MKRNIRVSFVKTVEINFEKCLSNYFNLNIPFKILSNGKFKYKFRNYIIDGITLILPLVVTILQYNIYTIKLYKYMKGLKRKTS